MILSSVEYKAFWDNQESSYNRSESEVYLRKKADEHIGLIEYRSKKTDEILDIGCGAGELLFFVASELNVKTAIDYSDLLLNKARKNLKAHKEINFIKSDVFEYLSKAKSKEKIWMTTAAVNQYLDNSEVCQLIEKFCENKEAKSFYLFDTIDYIRYKMNICGSSYKNQSFFKKNIFRRLFKKIKCIINIIKLFMIYNRETVRLHSTAMGYGHSPQFWLFLAKKYNLEVEIVSSRYFEYRYHVILWKK